MEQHQTSAAREVDLTDLQVECLIALRDATDASLRAAPSFGGIASTSDLRTHPKARTPKVLLSLCDLGLAAKEGKEDRFGYPKPGFWWKITNLGREWLAHRMPSAPTHSTGP